MNVSIHHSDQRHQPTIEPAPESIAQVFAEFPDAIGITIHRQITPDPEPTAAGDRAAPGRTATTNILPID